jgi:hypothetical protein
MSLITEAVEKLRVLMAGSGLEDGIVTLKRNPDAPRCQYERGVCIEAHFGGGHGQVTTGSPLQAATRISFMYGASLGSPEERTAALAILNAAGGFLALTRKLHACRPEDYPACLSELCEVLGATRVACIGDTAVLPHELGTQLVHSPEEAEVILVVADGAIAPSTADLIERWRGKKRMIFLGPSFPGLCAMLNLEHWCPYGR